MNLRTESRKMTISPAQALLILIKKYRDNKPMLERLKLIYFLGINPSQNPPGRQDLLETKACDSSSEDTNDDFVVIHEFQDENITDHSIVDTFEEDHPYFLGENTLGVEDKYAIEILFSDSALRDYHIDFSSKRIDEDPSRRYFETHLAYQTIKYFITQINVVDLELHEHAFYHMEGMQKYLKSLENILAGEFGITDQKIYQEYANYIHKLNNATVFADFSNHERMAISYFVKFAFLGVHIAIFNMQLPLDIYKTGIYTNDAKGVVEKRGQLKTRSDFHMGILKSTMPMPREDLAYTESKSPYLKASDKSSYIEETQWTEDNFARLVHPFSNSISGTVLAQLRNMLFFKKCMSSPFSTSANSLKLYFILFNAILLYGTGGHTFHEYTVVLSLPQVQEAFKDIPGFNMLNLKSLFYTDNAAAFDKALNDTIYYNDMILKRAYVRESLKEMKAHSQINRNSFQTVGKRDAALQMIDVINVIQEKIKSKAAIFSSSSIKLKKFLNQELHKIKQFLMDGDLLCAKNALIDLSAAVQQKTGHPIAFNYGNTSVEARIIESLIRKLGNIPLSENQPMSHNVSVVAC